jgi:hypothetical protein
MKYLHLTEEAFLALAGNRLSRDGLRAAQSHLSVCATCREEYTDFQLAHSVVQRMAQIGYKEVLGTSLPAPMMPEKKVFAFPWESVLAVAAGCLCLGFFLFVPRTVPKAHAEELLSRAVQLEECSPAQRGFRIEVSGQTCAGGHRSETLVSFQQSITCTRALQKIQKSRWGSGNPLSAKTYVDWRKSLHRHSDHVTQQGASWKIETATDEDDLHTASLELDSQDYRPLKLTLDFASNEEVSIAEVPESLPLTAPVIETGKNGFPLNEADDPRDVLEAHAWTILRKLHADSGWEALVVREDDEVRVKAVVRNQARAKELEDAFAGTLGVVFDLRPNTTPGDVKGLFPERFRPTEDAPALATEWLRDRFPDTDESAAYSNQVLQRSQEILGRAFMLDQLRRRQIILAHCTCVKEIVSLIHAEKLELNALVAGLATDLEPLLGAKTKSLSGSLSLADAKALDAALHELLWRRSLSDGSTFDTSVQKLRTLIAKN